MKNILKRMTVFLLAALMIVGASGCYNESNLVAAEKGDISLSIGGYIFYLSNAYSAAAAKVGTETKVLSATIEDKDAKTWIRDYTEDQVKRYFYLEETFRDLELELSEEYQEGIASYTSFYWDTYGYGTSYEAMGISRESFESVLSRPYYLELAIFDAMYSPDGQFGVSDEDLSVYYEENYYTYESFTASLTTTDEDGASVDLTDEEKASLKETLEDYADQINSGDMTLTEAATDYADAAALESSTYTNPASQIDAASTDIELAVLDLDEDSEAIVVESDTTYAVVRRLTISDLTESKLEDDSERLTILQTWKSEEFQEYVDEEYVKIEGITYNNSAINSYSINKLVTDDNEKGTSSVASETSTVSDVSNSSDVSAESDASEVSESSEISEESDISEISDVSEADSSTAD